MTIVGILIDQQFYDLNTVEIVPFNLQAYIKYLLLKKALILK